MHKYTAKTQHIHILRIFRKHPLLFFCAYLPQFRENACIKQGSRLYHTDGCLIFMHFLHYQRFCVGRLERYPQATSKNSFLRLGAEDGDL
jgi:hypothetical protein